jgi:predicted nucleic acid-binding protein
MDQVLGFFDSNVLIAASLPEHVHHAAASARMARLSKGGGACAAHTLAEAYNTLTRHSSGYGMPPLDASIIIRHAARTYRLIVLTAAETAKIIEEAAQDGHAGPMIFDSLLIACARKAHARFIYTSNVRHFRRIAPDLAARIVEP